MQQKYSDEVATTSAYSPATPWRRRASIGFAAHPAITETPRIREIDGLRALSVLLVLLGHTGRAWFAEGTTGFELVTRAAYFGVLVFFVISGYIITRLFIAEAGADGRISVRRFYLRRIARILPAFYTYLLVITAAAALHVIDLPLTAVRDAALFLTNFPGTSTHWLVAHSWSLATEEQFYVIFPWIFAWGWTVSTRRFFLLSLAVPFVAWGALALAGQHGWANPFYHLTWIMTGVALSVYEPAATRLARRIPAIALAGLVVLVYLFTAHVISFAHEGLVEIPLSCFTIAMLLLKSREATGSWRQLLLHPATQWIGLASYSIYLWQQLFALRPSMLTPILTLGAAALSYHFVEQPIIRAARKRIYSDIPTVRFSKSEV